MPVETKSTPLENIRFSSVDELQHIPFPVKEMLNIDKEVSVNSLMRSKTKLMKKKTFLVSFSITWRTGNKIFLLKV